MKRYPLIVETLIFITIFLFFVLPPLFVTGNNYNVQAFTVWKFPYQQFFPALSSLVLYLFFYEKKSSWLKFFPALYSFCVLFCISLIIKFFSVLFSAVSEIQVELPSDFSAWCFCIMNFFFAAFYEEVIYRMYLPEALNGFFSRKVSRRVIFFIGEFLVCSVFAFAHIYLGIFSVINAFAAHIVLRICYKKTGNLWPCVFAHFAYNVISLILL